MVKICQRQDCEYPAIPRGKYCEIHKTTRRVSRNNFEERKTDESEEDEIIKRIIREQREEKQKRIEEDREILRQQTEEFNRTLQADMERLEKIEFEKDMERILEMTKREWLVDKKRKIISDDEIGEDCYCIRINMPTGLKINKKFQNSSTVENIRDFIDVYLYENNSNIKNYELVISFPLKKFTKDDSDVYLNTLNLSKKFVINLCDLDA